MKRRGWKVIISHYITRAVTAPKWDQHLYQGLLNLTHRLYYERGAWTEGHIWRRRPSPDVRSAGSLILDSRAPTPVRSKSMLFPSCPAFICHSSPSTAPSQTYPSSSSWSDPNHGSHIASAPLLSLLTQAVRAPGGSGIYLSPRWSQSPILLSRLLVSWSSPFTWTYVTDSWLVCLLFPYPLESNLSSFYSNLSKWSICVCMLCVMCVYTYLCVSMWAHVCHRARVKVRAEP